MMRANGLEEGVTDTDLLAGALLIVTALVGIIILFWSDKWT